MNKPTPKGKLWAGTCYELVGGRLVAVFVCLLFFYLMSGCAVLDKSAVLSKPEPKKLPGVIILLSDDIPAYTGITDELVAKLPENTPIINLLGNSTQSDRISGELSRRGNRHIVAIGPLAAQVAKQHGDGEIVFCQVFNYRALGLTDANMQGVSMLPPAELQFREWKKLNPGLERVGVITGSGHEALIIESSQAAQQDEIKLIHRVVQSDKEMLYAFKRLATEVQGLWLVPDDRVLSRRVLRDVMAYSVKHNLQVVVFHPELLQLGGLMSVGSTHSDVAEQVLAALRGGSRRAGASQTSLLPLKQIQVRVSSTLPPPIAQQAPVDSRDETDVQ